MYTLINFVGCVFRYLFVVLSLRRINKYGRNIKRDLIYCFLYVFVYQMLKSDNWRMYIVQCVWTILAIWFNANERKYERKSKIYSICALLSIYEIGSVLIDYFTFFIFAIIGLKIENPDYGLACSLMIKSIIFVVLLYWIPVIKIVQSIAKRTSLISYLLIVCIKIPFLYTEVAEIKVVKAMLTATICCTIIFFIISRIEQHNAEMERAKIEENNKKLSTKLHKSQEIIPAVVQILSDVTENSGKEMEEHETQKLLNEMTDLFGQQLKQNSKEDLQLKNFCSTGLKLLDQQLKVYQMEAVDRGVNFDIYVQAPISEIIKRENIDQLKLQRALGDLIRNAFRAIERNSNKCRAKGHVLLIIGCRYEGILEIAVVDNGAEFPLHVIEAFGRRGVTSWGTGNGLADTMEFAEETGASICVEEFDGKTNSFTKKVSMIFDKCRKNYYNSSRKELVGGSFWEKIEYL